MNQQIRNKRATYDYELTEKLEAGISLVGTEVKSLREGKISFNDSFCEVHKGECFVRNLHISEYEKGNIFNHNPTRKRKLLLKSREIERLDKKTKEKGLTIIPTRIYFNDRGWAKMEIALAKGKKKFDKRESLKKKDAKKEIKRTDW